ncbi:Contactin-associated protein-like 2 [Portunus trituberculatus]|uniref:Contactin-associated protein-like 2 n=1 Tax=Portunus trituberculatus TaxID=210409 RepID=A0A5B7FLA6_PORTR|nr:Contactin-associated protein-like 2 [Portunus trituberculatus]
MCVCVVEGGTVENVTETTAWTARNADYLQYIESDLGDIKNVTAIATQGRDDSQEYVTAYTLEYSRDGIHYSIIKGPKGNIMKNKYLPSSLTTTK